MIQPRNNLEKFFNPRSIAVVGATEKEGKVGNAIAKNVLELGYKGKIFLVNPSHETLFGRKCYSSLEGIKEEIDLAIIIVPAKIANGIISKGSAKAKNFVVISAGFSEIGEEGKKREKELAEIAEEKGLNILGPNCLGFIIPKIKLNASFAGGMPEPGNIALISQSGALAVALLDIAEKEGMKFSSIVSIGNKVQLDETKLMEYFAGDPCTKAIGVYLEGIKNGREFIHIVQKVSKNKPVVILKAGKTEKAQKAISSHTGALAGSDKILDAVLAKHGVIRADSLENFLGLLRLISASGAPKNNEVAIVTNAGGPGVLTTDAFESKTVKLSDFNGSVKKNLRKLLPKESSVENPVDFLGDAHEDRYKKTLNIIGGEKIGSIICVLTPQDQTPVGKIASEIVKFKNKSNKIVITVFIGGDKVGGAVKNLSENNIPNFSFPGQAVSALDKYYRWNTHQNEELEIAKEIINEDRKSKAKEIIRTARSEGRKALLFSEAEEIMKMYGIKTVETEILTPNEAVVSGDEFPVVAKLDSAKTLHKTDKQGVILDIGNQEELVKAVSKIRSGFPGENVAVQPMQDIQTELILGIKKDEIFGPVAVFGLGGIYTEIFKLVDFIIPPINIKEIKKYLLESKIGFLFAGIRGKKPYNIDEVAQILSGIMSLSQEADGIKELDINPLLVYNDGKEPVAVDIKIII